MLNFTDNPTNADQLLYLLYMGGYKVEVRENRLIVSPAHAIDDEMMLLIKQYKLQLIYSLKKAVK
jgi:hypothetical protein